MIAADLKQTANAWCWFKSNTTNLNQGGNATMFFIIEEAKETILDFPEGAVTVLWIYFALI